jgi:glycosyltransferase involved in cell wall biosynthesis
MKFSVIVPAHNEEDKIAKALKSIKTQSFQDFELIVVCDACTDHTKEIAQRYTDKVIEIEGHCSAAARNAGLDKATGDWVLFCDADDWYLHEYAFEMLADKIGKENEDVLIFTLIWRHIGYGTIRSPHGTIYPHVANKCWRRSSIGNTRFPEEVKVAEDNKFFNAMLAKGLKVVEWDMPLYYYNYLATGSKSTQLGRSAEHTKRYWGMH